MCTTDNKPARTLQLRKTHKYVGTYSGEDEWETIGRYWLDRAGKIVLDESDDDEEDYCDAGTRVYFLHVETDADDETIQQALMDEFTSIGCAHEYDCCGCISSYAFKWNVFKRHDDCWTVIQNNSRNY